MTEKIQALEKAAKEIEKVMDKYKPKDKSLKQIQYIGGKLYYLSEKE